jgi:hypothetical protein
MASQAELILIKTNIGGYFLDAIFKIEHTTALTITQHPVETGASISDYAYLNPAQVSLDIGMTDVAQDIIPGQFDGGAAFPSRSVNAYQLLKQLQAMRMPVQLVTRLNTYNNMLVANIVATEDKTTTEALRATITMQEILIASVTAVKISSRPQTTDSTNKGTVQPTVQNASALYLAGVRDGPTVMKTDGVGANK